jgi:hypothetical protein
MKADSGAFAPTRRPFMSLVRVRSHAERAEKRHLVHSLHQLICLRQTTTAAVGREVPPSQDDSMIRAGANMPP